VAVTSTNSVSYTVSYIDANFNASTLVAANVALNTTGTATGTVSVSGGGASWTVLISGISGDGALGISIAAGTASDTAGNLAPAAGPSATFTVDNTAPSVAISAPSATESKTGPVTYTILYSDLNFNTSTLSIPNVTLNHTYTATGSISVSGTGTNRTVTISGITGDGRLGISIGAGTASDTAGNLAPAAGPGTTFVVDNTTVTTHVQVVGPNTYNISLHGATNFLYQVQCTFTINDPNSWRIIGPVNTDTSGNGSIQDVESTSASKYYRVVIP
jgi:hypothetical protein